MSRKSGKHYKKKADVKSSVASAVNMSTDGASAVKKPKMKTWKKTLIVVIIVILAITGGVFGYMYSKLGKLNREDIDKSKLSCVDVDGYVNILLLGVDARDMKNYKNSRTDCIIIASIEEKTGKVYLTSIYRDTYLKMGGDDLYDKITHAFVYGGPQETIKTVNQAMDLNIDKFVVFNFKTVADTVDYLGGVTVDVEDYEIDELNKFTIDSAEHLGVSKYKLVTEPGKQKLHGPQAVSYGRIRKGVGDDFKRTERMRSIVEKCIAKAKKQNIKKLDGLVDKIMPQIKTNMSNGDIFYFARHLSKYKMVGSKGFPYQVEGGMIDGVSYVIPVDLEADVIKLHKKVFHQKDYKPSKKCKEISNHIKGVLGGGVAPSQEIIVPEQTNTEKSTEETTVHDNKPETPDNSQHSQSTANTGGQEQTPAPAPTPTPETPDNPVQPEPSEPPSEAQNQ